MAIIKELIADEYGSAIIKKSERLQLHCKGEMKMQAPLMHLESVLVLSRGVTISADAIEACCQRGIPVHFLNNRGEPYAALYAAGLSGTVVARREQMLALREARGVHLARAFAAGKINNQAVTLRYLAKNRRESNPTLYEELNLRAGEVLDHLAWLDRLEGESADEVRGSVLAAEGNAAQHYWDALRLVLPGEYNWPGRIGRGANDSINALLNYGYGILYQQVQRAIVLAGLDPYAGFIHTDRPGKPSLVLDLIEEFRQAAVDRVVIGLATRGFKAEREENGLLALETRRTYADHILKHLEAGTRYQGKRHSLRAVIQIQARELAAYLRGDRDIYKPYQAEW